MKRDALSRFAFVLSIFLIMLVWAVWIHPFVVVNRDDWYYMSNARQLLPMPWYWNPARVMPEITMPLFGGLAAYLIYPLTGDYVNSLSISCALAFASFLALYVGMFRRFIQKRFQLPFSASVFVSAFFFLFHFYAFRTAPSGNVTVLYANTPTSLFYYSIPTFLNLAVLLYLETLDDVRALWDPKRALRTSLVLLGIYLAIFSNLYSSIVLAVYVGVKALLSAIRLLGNKRERDFKAYLRDNFTYLLIVALWAMSALLEYFGGRSRDLQSTVRYSKGVLLSLRGFIATALTLRKTAVLLWILLALAVLAVYAADRKKRGKALRNDYRPLLDCLAFTAPCAVLSAAFLILLSSKVWVAYIGRSDVWMAILCFVFLFLAACIAFLLKSFPRLTAVAPLALLALACAINTRTLTFVDGTQNQIPASVAKQLSRSLVEEIVAADQRGALSIVLDVPLNASSPINFPFNESAGEALSKTLYAHKIISRQIEITIHPTVEVNERFHLDENFQYAS